MIVYDQVKVMIEGKGEYENSLDENGNEMEWLNGVGLTDGHYCKYYKRARDWSDRSVLDREGKPAMQHYCAKTNQFGGWACCCWPGGSCFEKGKSAGVKRVRDKIRKRRMFD